MLAITYVMAWNQAVDGDFLRAGVLARAHELARKAVQLDPHLPQARVSLGLTLVWMRQSDAAIAEFEKAVALNPNFTDVRFSIALVYAGEPGRAVEVTKAHMRLDPFYIATTPGWASPTTCWDAIRRRCRRCANASRERRTSRGGHLWLAATCAQLGLPDEARAHVAEVLRIQPNYTIGGTQAHLLSFKNEHDAEHYLDGLRKTGLPER